jgi:C_GCAxxG_C_C family probable redox protein
VFSLLTKIKMTKSERAIHYFRNGYNCSQSVFTPFAQQQGITEDQGLKIACAFGAGMARQQHTCGAVTGALMALGLQYGKGVGDDDNKKAETYAKTLSFVQAFTGRNGSISCKELMHGLDMNNPADMKKIEMLDFHNNRCTRYVLDAIEITENLLNT